MAGLMMEVRNAHQRHYTSRVLPGVGICIVVLGIFMFASGIAVLVNQKDHAALSSVPFQSAAVVILIAGILSIIAGSVEVIAMKCRECPPAEAKKYLLIFLIVLLLSALLAFVAGIMAFVYTGQVGNKMEDDLTVHLKQYGVTGHYGSLVSVNRVQSKNQCCGVINYADWRNTTYGGHRYDKVPDSCCTDQVHACGFEFELSKINRRGCLKLVRRSASNHLKLVGIGGILVAIIQFGLAAAVQYIRRKKLG